MYFIVDPSHCAAMGMLYGYLHVFGLCSFTSSIVGVGLATLLFFQGCYVLVTHDLRLGFPLLTCFFWPCYEEIVINFPMLILVLIWD